VKDQVVEGSKVQVIILESLTADLIDQECAVLVTGITKDINIETLQMYFENERKSGGGEIKDFHLNKAQNSVVITFDSAKGSIFEADVSVCCIMKHFI